MRFRRSLYNSLFLPFFCSPSSPPFPSSPRPFFFSLALVCLFSSSFFLPPTSSFSSLSALLVASVGLCNPQAPGSHWESLEEGEAVDSTLILLLLLVPPEFRTETTEEFKIAPDHHHKVAVFQDHLFASCSFSTAPGNWK